MVYKASTSQDSQLWPLVIVDTRSRSGIRIPLRNMVSVMGVKQNLKWMDMSIGDETPKLRLGAFLRNGN